MKRKINISSLRTWCFRYLLDCPGLIRCVVIISFCSVVSKALCQVDNFEDSKLVTTLYGGLYTGGEEAWSLEPSVDWNFNRYFGVGLGIEYTKQIFDHCVSTTINNMEASVLDREREVSWLMFKPHVVIRSPYVWLSKNSEVKLWVQAEPGLSMGVPEHNSITFGAGGPENSDVYQETYKLRNKGLRWFYWNSRFSANVMLDCIIIGAGYAVSNFDYYSCRRNVMLPSGDRYPVPRKRLAQNVFLSVGCCF